MDNSFDGNGFRLDAIAGKLLNLYRVEMVGNDDPDEDPLFELRDQLATILAAIDGAPEAVAYQCEPQRNCEGEWHGQLAYLMADIGFFWVLEMEPGNLPGGPFPDPPHVGPPLPDTGAAFST